MRRTGQATRYEVPLGDVDAQGYTYNSESNNSNNDEDDVSSSATGGDPFGLRSHGFGTSHRVYSNGSAVRKPLGQTSANRTLNAISSIKEKMTKKTNRSTSIRAADGPHVRSSLDFESHFIDKDSPQTNQQDDNSEEEIVFTPAIKGSSKQRDRRPTEDTYFSAMSPITPAARALSTVSKRSMKERRTPAQTSAAVQRQSTRTPRTTSNRTPNNHTSSTIPIQGVTMNDLAANTSPISSVGAHSPTSGGLQRIRATSHGETSAMSHRAPLRAVNERSSSPPRRAKSASNSSHTHTVDNRASFPSKSNETVTASHRLQQVQDLEEQVAELSRALQESQAHAAKLQDSLQNELSEEWEKHQRMVESLEEREARLDQRQDEWRSVENELKQTEEAQADESARLSRWQEELAKNQQAFSQEKEDFQLTMAEHAQEMDDKRQKWEKAVARQSEDLQSQQQELEDLNSELEEQQKHLDRRAEDLAKQALLLDERQHEIDLDLVERHSSKEAEVELLQQAVEDLQVLRRDEEKALLITQKALKEARTQQEKIQKDSQTVKEALQQRLALGHQEFQEKEKELEEVKRKIQVFLHEDKKSRAIAASKARESAQKLDASLQQIMVAQREQENLKNKISQERSKLDDIRQSYVDTQAALKKERELIDSQCQELEEDQRVRERSWEEREAAFKSKEEDLLASISKREQESLERINTEQASLEKQRVETLASLQTEEARIEAENKDLSLRQSKLEEAWEQLQREKMDCDNLRRELNERVVQFAATEGREKRNRQEAEWQAEQHQKEILKSNERLEEMKAERDVLVTRISSLQKQLTDLQADHKSTIAILEKQLKDVEAKSDSESRRADKLQKDMEQARIESIDEHDHVSKLLSGVERQSALLDDRTHELDEKEADLEDLTKRLTERESELDILESELHTTQQELLENQIMLDKERQELQQYALSDVLDRPLRRDQESKSAALSKWVRVTMFDRQEADSKELSNQLEKRLQDLEDSQRMVNRLKEEKQDLILRLDELSMKLNTKNANESSLISQMNSIKEEMQLMKRKLEDRSTAQNKERHLLQTQLNEAKDEHKEVVAKFEARIEEASKARISYYEKQLRQMEERVHSQDFQSSSTAEELRWKITALEEDKQALHEQLQNEREQMMEQAARKESELIHRETRLEEDIRKCEERQQRLQALASQIQKKALQLAQDEKAMKH